MLSTVCFICFYITWYTIFLTDIFFFLSFKFSIVCYSIIDIEFAFDAEIILGSAFRNKVKLSAQADMMINVNPRRLSGKFLMETIQIK